MELFDLLVLTEESFYDLLLVSISTPNALSLKIFKCGTQT